MSKKGQRHKNLTATYIAGNLDEEKLRHGQRFTQRGKNFQRDRTAKTAQTRREDPVQIANVDALPLGRVVQVHSVYYEVEYEGAKRLCVVRKTVSRTSETRVVVGDLVRFSNAGETEGVIERIEPRKSILTRADVRAEKDKIVGQIPIIANADQMLIVASLLLPRIKWGLIDRMIVAALTGNLVPIVCLNKIDLVNGEDSRVSTHQSQKAREEADEAINQYQSMGITVVQTSARSGQGVAELRALLREKITILAGHSGVGKSSLITAVQPELDIRVGEISNHNQKGRHTTTSARTYDLPTGGAVIDTPGVKLFGLHNVSPDSLITFFPDVAANTAPPWRRESYQRIVASL